MRALHALLGECLLRAMVQVCEEHWTQSQTLRI